jgi:hypothetical protein
MSILRMCLIHICLNMRGGTTLPCRMQMTPLQTFYVHGSTTSRQNQETLLHKLLWTQA